MPAHQNAVTIRKPRASCKKAVPHLPDVRGLNLDTAFWWAGAPLSVSHAYRLRPFLLSRDPNKGAACPTLRAYGVGWDKRPFQSRGNDQEPLLVSPAMAFRETSAGPPECGHHSETACIVQEGGAALAGCARIEPGYRILVGRRSVIGESRVPPKTVLVEP